MDISEVEFGSLLSYSVRGTSKKVEESKSVMRNLKQDSVLSSGILTSEYVAQAMKKEIEKYPFADFFNSNAVLVPIPRSSLPITGMLWIPERITTALINNGLGRSSEPCLERVSAVSRSSGQRIGVKRATPSQHYESMRVRELLFEPKEIVVVDDVVTRGSTFLGGVNRLAETFPNAKIRAFAVMRSIYDLKDFSDIVDPRKGKITMYGDVPQRIP
jgi:predicted amidophosphoribosyltransferase